MVKEKFHDVADRFNLALEMAGYTKERYKNLTITLARLFRVSQSSVCYWRMGCKCPTIEHATIISKKLNIQVDWLLTGRGEMRPTTPTSPDQVLIDLSWLPSEKRADLIKAVEHLILVFKSTIA